MLHGHPLYGRGLEYSGAHVIANSRWYAELEAINSVHDQYDPDSWDSRHFLFVFHDETLDVIARDVSVETFHESLPTLLAQTAARLSADA